VAGVLIALVYWAVLGGADRFGAEPAEFDSTPSIEYGQQVRAADGPLPWPVLATSAALILIALVFATVSLFARIGA
jgi:hypothetical protein